MFVLYSSKSSKSCKYCFWAIKPIVKIPTTICMPVEVNSVQIKNKESENKEDKD
jgi:hypothetical protein